jgi:tetratricopeptide (TPR) repeat protein
MNNLALVYRSLGRYPEAESLFAEVLETSRRVLGVEHPLTLACLTNLAILYRYLERYDEAEALYLEALEAKRRVLGEEHPHTAACLSSLGKLYRIQARYDEAEPLLVKAMNAYRHTLGEEHRHTFVPMYNLALVYHEQERLHEAEALIRQVYDGRRKILGSSNHKTLEAQHALAKTLVTLDKLEEAERFAGDLLALLRDDPQRPVDLLVQSLDLLADIRMRNGTPEAAEPLLREGLQIRRTSLPHDDPTIATTHSLLGGCLTAQERYEEAEPLVLQSFADLQCLEGGEADLCRVTCGRIIDLYEAWGDLEKVAEYQAILTEALAP